MKMTHTGLKGGAFWLSILWALSCASAQSLAPSPGCSPLPFAGCDGCFMRLTFDESKCAGTAEPCAGLSIYRVEPIKVDAPQPASAPDQSEGDSYLEALDTSGARIKKYRFPTGRVVYAHPSGRHVEDLGRSEAVISFPPNLGAVRVRLSGATTTFTLSEIKAKAVARTTCDVAPVGVSF